MGDGDATGLILIMMMCCCMLLIAASGGYYWYIGGGKEAWGTTEAKSAATETAEIASLGAAATTASDTPSPSPADPKAALLATGQAIQVAEKDISSAGTFSDWVTDTTRPVAYTISVFLNIEKTSDGWRNLFLRGNDDGADRHPGIFINPSTTALHFRHGVKDDGNFGIDITATALTPGTYQHVAFVNDGLTLSVYINGVKDANTKGGIVPANPFIWTTGNTFKYFTSGAANGYVKVKELYVFDKALTDSEIKTLSTGVSTTSTYSPEPISFGYFTEFLSAAKPSAQPQSVASAAPEPITSSAGDYLGILE